MKPSTCTPERSITVCRAPAALGASWSVGTHGYVAPVCRHHATPSLDFGSDNQHLPNFCERRLLRWIARVYHAFWGGSFTGVFFSCLQKKDFCFSSSLPAFARQVSTKGDPTGTLTIRTTRGDARKRWRTATTRGRYVHFFAFQSPELRLLLRELHILLASGNVWVGKHSRTIG